MRSISKTITISTIVSVGLILALGQIFIDFTISRWLEEKFDNTLESKARTLVTLTKFDGNEVELDFADEFMPEFEAPSEPEYFELFLNSGELLERSNSFSDSPHLSLKKHAKEVYFNDVILPDGRDGRQVTIEFVVQIDHEDEHLEDLLEKQISFQDRPRAIVRISRERESLNQARQNLHFLILGITLTILLVIVITIPRLIRTGLLPLHRMKDDISEITHQNLDHRIDDRNQSIELEPIAKQFNLVLNEIEKAFMRERQFSSDVAHELRTPVSEIRSLAEVGVRWPDEEDIRTYFGDIYESAKNLDKLIENLLHLCRSEEGSIEVIARETNVVTLINDASASLGDECDGKAIDIQLPANGPIFIFVDPKWIELILHNLLINAISHSPPDAKIGIILEVEDNYCRLEIHNPMLVPLTDEDLNHMFLRFWQKDSARESGLHAGIGLSLVKSYADLMGIDIDAWIKDERIHIILSSIPISKRASTSA